MKNILLLLLIVGSIISQSCSKIIPLTGKYQNGSVKTKIDEPFNQVWNRVIDFIAESGVSAKMIDKASGLIVADVTSLYGSITHENSSGALVNPKAYVVSERYSGNYHGTPKLYTGTGNWNMRIKETSDNTCVVSINFHSILVKNISAGYVDAKSTGVLERLIIDNLFIK